MSRTSLQASLFAGSRTPAPAVDQSELRESGGEGEQLPLTPIIHL